MKAVLISILFFFGPVILMFALRYVGLLLRFWLLWRRQKKSDADVIDITPRTSHPPSVRFIIFAVIAGLVIAGLVWKRLSDENNHSGAYIPAHTDQKGNLTPGHFQGH